MATLTILAPSTEVEPILVGEDTTLPGNKHHYFCAGCGKHREEFKPSECLRIFKHGVSGKVFAGFYCHSCFRLETPKEEIRYCCECNVLPAANPDTDLCHRCAPIPINYRRMSRSEKLSVLV